MCQLPIRNICFCPRGIDKQVCLPSNRFSVPINCVSFFFPSHLTTWQNLFERPQNYNWRNVNSPYLHGGHGLSSTKGHRCICDSPTQYPCYLVLSRHHRHVLFGFSSCAPGIFNDHAPFSMDRDGHSHDLLHNGHNRDLRLLATERDRCRPNRDCVCLHPTTIHDAWGS